jgi:hypothetical protein
MVELNSHGKLWLRGLGGFLLVLSATFCFPRVLSAQTLEDLLELDLSVLVDMKVITPARRGQTATEAPANVTIITREMIRRRGIEPWMKFCGTSRVLTLRSGSLQENFPRTFYSEGSAMWDRPKSSSWLTGSFATMSRTDGSAVSGSISRLRTWIESK